MNVITIISFLFPMFQLISSDRYYPTVLTPGESRISLSPNMFRKTKETKEDLEAYLRDNAPYRRYHLAFNRPEKTREALEQYLYEKYNTYRKSGKHDPFGDVKYMYDNAPYRKSLQQFRSLPVYVVALKNEDSNEYDDDRYKSQEKLGGGYKKVLRFGNGNNRYKNFQKSEENKHVYKKVLMLENNKQYKKALRREDKDNANKKVLRLGEEERLECVAVKTRRQHHYDSTSSSSSKEFHSGEKRQFKKWRQHYVCGSAEMQKYTPPISDQALRPLNYKSTNRLLNDLLKEKRWRPGNPKLKRLRPPPAKPKGVISPVRRKTESDLVPPRTEFELNELVI